METHVEHLKQTLKWQGLSEIATWVIEQAVAIQQIPAPTFQERPRALHVADQFTALGLHQVELDDLHNVYGLLPGTRSSLPAVLISAHTDTVFPAETPLTVSRQHDQLLGPGLGDNSLGVAALLGLAHTLRRMNYLPGADLWFVATTREEGLGDLGGMRAAFQRLQPRIGAVVNLEGLAFGHVYHAGIAVRRLHITASAPGGHSWLHYGRSSAIHGIVQVGARIVGLQPPASPRTTFNIGMIEGGQSINSIATQAGLWLDLRSEDSAALHGLEQQVRAHIAASGRPDLSFEVEVVGDRPSGQIPVAHPLVKTALSALEQVGVRGTLETGSTDANIPLAAGCPAVTIGITRGGNAHRTDEFIETRPVEAGLQQMILLVLAAASG